MTTGVCMASDFGRYMTRHLRPSGLRTQSGLAKAIAMDIGQLNKIFTGRTQRPEIETLEKIATALNRPIEEVMREAGYPPTSTLSGGGVLGLIAAQPGTSEEYPPAPNAEGDYDYQEVRRYVESNPNPHLRARLARQEARRTPESYQRLIFRIFKAWMANVDFGLGEAEEEDDDRPGTDR